MKNLLYILLFVPLFFVSSCEEEEKEESCTGNSTADLIVGTWEVNSVTLYYPNGDFYGCYNSCNSTNNLCTDIDCVISTYNCDGTAYSQSSNETDSFTWSYDPQTEMVTTISTLGVFYSTIITLNSNQLVDSSNLLIIDENGNQINVEAIYVATRIN